MIKKENCISVTKLNEQIKDVIMGGFTKQMNVQGEISNVKISNGHTFLTLKDEGSSINVVSWNNKFDHVSNGDDVIVHGKISCYPKQGTYQILANKIEKIGIGNLHEKLENDKKIFDESGYFIKSKKKENIPVKINRVAIITSKEGAALQDILYQLKNNNFCGEVLIKNCSAQGPLCPKSVEEGIKYFTNLHKTKHIDVMLITRGGGSFEDLMGYSSKEIVKAIYETPIYTISAVGHEVDTMLSDYASNYRAPTPSIAGELISLTQRKKLDNFGKILENTQHAKQQIINKIKWYESKINVNNKLLKSINPNHFIKLGLDELTNAREKIHNVIMMNLNEKLNIIDKLEDQLEIYNSSKIFHNGYVAIVDGGNNLVNSVEIFNKNVKNKQKLKLIFSDGEIDLSALLEHKNDIKKGKDREKRD